MRKITDLSGKTFGRLTVISFAHNNDGRVWWNCRCTCGNNVIQRSDHFKSGIVVSCGCFHSERTKALFTKHGESYPPYSLEYSAWLHMKARCLNPKHKHFHNYGGRGITVCKRWMRYENFLSDMGRAPSIDNTIDRIKVNGNYTPKNCRWATPDEQHNNKRNSIKMEYKGIIKSQSQWCRHFKIPYTTATMRRRKGLSFLQIFGLNG